jgi:hypothetical protein
VRKELAALTRADRRAGADAGEWAQAVDEFYADHAAFVAQTLRLPLEVAEGYVVQQSYIAHLGLPALVAYEATALRVLTWLALEQRTPEGDDNV